MNLIEAIFYSFEGLAAIAAISLLFVRNIFHAALALLVCLLCIAAIFAMSAAEFPAVSQILLYAGGIVVLMIFGIMLTSKTNTDSDNIKNNNTAGAIALGLSTFFLLIFFSSKWLFVLPKYTGPKPSFNPIQTIGIELMTDYVLPFEITGVLLLIVLAGAATVAGFKSKKL